MECDPQTCGIHIPTYTAGRGAAISEVSSTTSCLLLNLEPRGGAWTHLPSAWAVPGLEMLVLLTLHPKPSPGSRQVISPFTQMTDGILTSLLSISPAQPEAPERQQLCPFLLRCQAPRRHPRYLCFKSLVGVSSVRKQKTITYT